MQRSTHKPLYLKYRPLQLSSLVGQQAVFTTLSNAIAHNRLSHAYLFTGPRGTGKTSTARILAKSLNCESGPTDQPCLQCTSCLEIAESISPAVFEIDAASNNSVDDARSLIERAPLVAVGGRFKLYIIDECHMLTKEAFNALLKTIEEPPANVIFVLATTEEHKVPATIVSRCQRLMFRLVSHDDLEPHLAKIAHDEQIEIEAEALALICRRSGGGLRDALGLLDQASLLAQPGKPVSINSLLSLLGSVAEDILCEMSQFILAKQGQSLLTCVNKLLMEGREPAVIAQELARHFLNLTKASYLLESKAAVDEGKTLIIGSSDYLSALWNQAGNFERCELSQMVEQLDKLEQACRRTTQPSMQLEMGLLSLCHRHDLFVVQELVSRIQALEEQISKNTQLPTIRPTAAPVAPAAAPATEVGAPKVAYAASRPPTSADTTIRTAAPAAATAGSAQPLEVKQPQDSISPSMSTKAQEPLSLPTPPVADAFPHEAENSGEIDSSEDLDQFWSSLIDTLADRHRPTWSLVSMHAFPVSLSQKELSVGVLKANFQKMIEGKSEHLKQACELLLHREVTVKVRVLSQAPAKTNSSLPAPAKTPAPITNASSAEQSSGQPDSPTASAVVISRQQTHIAMPDGHDIADSSYVVKEAYQLFDGPGSRQIG